MTVTLPMWLSISSATRVVDLMRRQPKQPVLDKDSAGRSQRPTQHERRDVLLLDRRGLADGFERFRAQANVQAFVLRICHRDLTNETISTPMHRLDAAVCGTASAVPHTSSWLSPAIPVDLSYTRSCSRTLHTRGSSLPAASSYRR